MERFTFGIVLLLTLQMASLMPYDASTSSPGDWFNFWNGPANWTNVITTNVKSLVKCATGDCDDIEDLMMKCYGKFGCFKVGGPWKNDLTRPVSLFPLTPEEVKPHYCLYTRRNPNSCETLIIDDSSSIYRSSFTRGKQVYFIAHGFVEHGDRTWIHEMTAELLKRSVCNVIVIGWQGGSKPPYTQAVANIRLVGVMTAHLMKMLASADIGFETSRVHVIGHSLGAHLAGYIGTALQKNYNLTLGRITGLDPAAPHFASTDPIVRLDPTDAIFVDNIHTDATLFIRWGLGMKDPIGHVDFFPNGGKDQPGCTDGFKGSVDRENGSLIDGVRRWLNCDHIKSYQFFTPTINGDLPTLAVECPSYDHYLNGSCFDCNANADGYPTCAKMGFHSIDAYAPVQTRKFKDKVVRDINLKESPKRKYQSMFLITHESEPFYKSQYRVTIKISPNSRDAGSFQINLIGDEETDYLPLKHLSKYFDAGMTYTIVIAGPTVGPIKRAVLKWTYESSLINPFSWRFGIHSMQVDEVIVETLGHPSGLKMCYENKIISNYPVELSTDCPQTENLS